METAPTSKDIVKQIFLEEHYVEAPSMIKDSAVFLETEVFFDIAKIKKMLEDFYELPFLEQQGYIKHFKTIIQTLELANINMLIDKLFDRDFSPRFFDVNPPLVILLLDAIDTILFMVFEEGKRAKAKTDITDDTRVSVMLEASMGIIEQSVLYEQEVISNSVIINFCKMSFKSSKVAVREKLVPILEKVTKYSSQFERDQKILKFLSEELNAIDSPRLALSLECISTSCEYFTPALLEIILSRHVRIFIKNKSSLIRETAFSVLVRVVSILDASTVQKNYSETIKLMATDLDIDVKIVFISSFSVFIPKLSLNFIISDLLPQYYLFQSSNNLNVRVEFFSSLSQVIVRLLLLIKKNEHPNVNCIQEAFKLYFNLILYTEEFRPFERFQIMKNNYKDLYVIFKIFGKGLWPYLKYLFQKLDGYSDYFAVEQVKLAMIGPVFKLGRVLGQELLEREALTVVDSTFLILNLRTTINVKMKAMPLVYKLLREVAPEKRKFFADYYIMLQDDAKKWRIKAAICNQIQILVKLFDVNDVVSFILPLVVKLCKDECASVRKIAARQFHWLYDSISKRGPHYLFLLEDYVRSLAEDSSYLCRLAFIDMYEIFIERLAHEIWTDFDQIILKMTEDKVTGIRIRLAGLCADLCNKYGNEELFDQIEKALAGDKDKEVKKRLQMYRDKKNKGLVANDKNSL